MTTQAEYTPHTGVVPNEGNLMGKRQDDRSGWAIGLAEAGLLPDWMIRAGIRRLNRQRQHEINAHDHAAVAKALKVFVRAMAGSEVAPVPHKANEQHYEVPPEFFTLALGKHRKYSCGFWPAQVESLDDAEAEALRETCKHAGIADAMEVLDLGCGWGSLSLWIARHYPGCNITSVSNSTPQRDYITAVAQEEGLDGPGCILG